MKPKKTQIEVAKSAGFCFGVNRAVQLVYELTQKGKKVATLGPIIHNAQVVEDLKKKGVTIIEDVCKAPKDTCVVLRSHGVVKEVFRQLEERGLKYLDATCPFVSKIHTLVAQAGNKNVFIAGNPLHPEVVGIRSYCQKESFVFETPEEFQRLLEEKPHLRSEEGILVAQTTFHRKFWEDISDIAKKCCTKLAIFDTICYATCERQSEAALLAQKSELMVVVGGKNSSNTDKLKKVCEAYTPTILIEQASELDPQVLRLKNKIGITAGASTPAHIIKEVHERMNKLVENPSEELSFAELLEQSEETAQKLYPGKQIEGTIVSITRDEVQVDIGGKQSGIIPHSEWSARPVENLRDQAKSGDTLQLIVLKVNEQDGLVTLSKKQMDAQKDYQNVIDAMEKDIPLSGVIERAIKGGVLVKYKELSVFVPLSQLSLRRVEHPEEMVGQEVAFRVLEVNPRQKKVVGSIRKELRAVQKEKEEQIWQTIAVGQKFVGTVQSMTNYGAFVDIGGVDGMIHISDLSWSKIKHPSEIVKVGDSVEVYVKDLDEERHRISLGYKKFEDSPWAKFEQAHHVGEVVKGKIVSLSSFGAFMEIEPDIDGLIHISQISTQRVEKPSDVLKVGQEVEAQILHINAETKRVGLSIRVLQQKKEAEQEKQQRDAVNQIEGVQLLQEGEQAKAVSEKEEEKTPLGKTAEEEKKSPVEAVEQPKEEKETEAKEEKPKEEKPATKKRKTSAKSAAEKETAEKADEEPAEEKKTAAKKKTTTKASAKGKATSKTAAEKKMEAKTSSKKTATKKKTEDKEEGAVKEKKTASKTTAKASTKEKAASKTAATKKTATKTSSKKAATKKEAANKEEGTAAEKKTAAKTTKKAKADTETKKSPAKKKTAVKKEETNKAGSTKKTAAKSTAKKTKATKKEEES